MEPFLPMSKSDMGRRGWEELDFVLVSGDAYVDHPAFGSAIIGRWLEAKGFRVGIIAQPNWRTTKDFRQLGAPRLGFLVSSGNLDSMVNHYSAAKRRRKTDVYSPGGRIGLRPDRAAVVYANRIREAYGSVPIILGGLEASLRRLAHYDYWDDAVRRSILLDAKADLLIYGMGERPIADVAEALAAGLQIADLSFISGTVFRCFDLAVVHEPILLPSFSELRQSKQAYGDGFVTQLKNADPITGRTLAEPYDDYYVVQNPPAMPLGRQELDMVYRLPFQRAWHPSYDQQGGVPALAEVKFSLVSSRGCFGGCSFCSLHFHQGRIVQSRSIESLVEEAEQLTKFPDFKGYIHDVGGPTANFRHPACEEQVQRGSCAHRPCLSPRCPNLAVDQGEYADLLQRLRQIPGIKKVFVRSGLRYDYLLYDQDREFLTELCRNHISGQLKVAPEHVNAKVLQSMGKPEHAVYERFRRQYEAINRSLGKEQFLVPYFMSNHPGSDLHAAVELAEYVRDMGHSPQQTQDFYPTPGTLATCMYYCGFNPLTGAPVHVPRSKEERAMQRALIYHRNPKNWPMVRRALSKAKRQDLIGYGAKALVPPERTAKKKPGTFHRR